MGRTEEDGSDDFELGDHRLNKRARFVSERLLRAKGGPLPAAFPEDAEIEGTYRLLGHEDVAPEALLMPHRRQALSRARRSVGTLLAVHDGTELKFGGDYLRPGLTLLPNGTQGFHAHVSLLCSVKGEARQVHGVLNIESTFNDKTKQEYVDPWAEGAGAVEEQVGPGQVIHVIDREADSYLLQAKLQAAGARYVIRSSYNRRAQDDAGVKVKLADAIREVDDVILCRRVQLNARYPAESGKKSRSGLVPLKGAAFRRTPINKRSNPPRRERIARLQVTAGSYLIRKPNFVPTEKAASQLSINIVRVYEPKPPADSAPVEWLLLTNEPIETPEQVERVVDAYCARWLIEDYFKALKTGCGFEKLQLEQRRSFLNALALYASVAWRLLYLRASAQNAEAPASPVLTPIQLKILKFARPKAKLSASPSPTDIMLAVASLGGHIKNNGPPGWMVLGRGLIKLLEAELGYLAAQDEM